MSSEYPLVERLECRRLFVGTADLSPIGEPEIRGEAILRPGEGRTFSLRFHEINVSSPFKVAFRLTPKNFFTPFFNAPPTYTAPGSFVIGAITFNGAADANGDAIASGKLTVPVNVTPGTYVLAAKLDSTDAILEEDAEDNNIAIAFTDLHVLRSDGVMILNGTDDPDTLAVQRVDYAGSTFIDVNPGEGQLSIRYSAAFITGFNVSMLGGNDLVTFAGNLGGIFVDGGAGDDRIVGGDGNDLLSGGLGRDVIDGGLGNDLLKGGGGNDKLFGNVGSDRLYGYAGNDYLDGGGNSDRIDGGAGADVMYGQAGNDIFTAIDGTVDHIFGGRDRDTATSVDATDVLEQIEVRPT